jgi:hypothetical protein
MKHFRRAKTLALAIATFAATILLWARESRAAATINILYTPPGVQTLNGVMICSSVGLDTGWCSSADFQAAAGRMGIATAQLIGGNEFGAYDARCSGGEFKALLDAIAAAGAAKGHPELANAPIIGMGHSHGGDYWNYFNACYPDRMALVFCKSSGGVTLTGEALKTPAVWEVGMNDLRSNCCGMSFRAQSMAYRAKGTPMSLVLGPGETHGQLGAAPRAMVITLIEAIFKLRVPANADLTKPVPLNEIDESSGCYWLGDNYTKEVSPYASSPDKNAISKTSFLPTASIAMMWKTAGAMMPATIVVENGTCANCYPAPPGEPPATQSPTITGCGATGGMGGSDAGAIAMADAGDDGTSGPATPADAAAPPTTGTDDASGGSPTGQPTGSPAGMDASAGVGNASASGSGGTSGASPNGARGCACVLGGPRPSREGSVALLALGLLAFRRRWRDLSRG